jgi:hypothetical protein
MALNEPVRYFHHFHDIDLIAIRGLARIFPNQQTLTVLLSAKKRKSG